MSCEEKSLNGSETLFAARNFEKNHSLFPAQAISRAQAGAVEMCPKTRWVPGDIMAWNDGTKCESGSLCSTIVPGSVCFSVGYCSVGHCMMSCEIGAQTFKSKTKSTNKIASYSTTNKNAVGHEVLQIFWTISHAEPPCQLKLEIFLLSMSACLSLLSPHYFISSPVFTEV